MINDGKHYCELVSPKDIYGAAITEVYEDDDGRLWAGNGEYASQVNYCPVCGHKAARAAAAALKGNNES